MENKRPERELRYHLNVQHRRSVIVAFGDVLTGDAAHAFTVPRI